MDLIKILFHIDLAQGFQSMCLPQYKDTHSLKKKRKALKIRFNLRNNVQKLEVFPFLLQQHQDSC